MHGGKRGTPVSHISQAYADRVEVRGRDLTGDLLGRLTFTEYFHLLLTGREPTEDERFFLDVLLVAIAEHGLMPSNVAARMTLAADPSSLQGAVAAGILGAGSVVLGASEECARLLERGGDPMTIARTIHEVGGRVPGFGHPVHKPVDPRAERILSLADERGVSGPARHVRARIAQRGRRGLGEALADERRHADRGGHARSGISVRRREGGSDSRADGRPARAPRRRAGAAARLPPRAGGGGRGRVRVNVETRPWADQFAVDDESFRKQLSYLLERSAFYREKLAGVQPVGLADIAELPLTDKQELRATCTRENPFGAHLCAEPSELERIYSTSGTTGTPSYVPLTATDLENWITGSARSYAASGISAGQRIVSTYNAGPFVAGVALASFERLGLCHIPFGTGNSERLVRAVEQLKPQVVVLTPSYAAHLAERNPELAASSVERVLVAGEPGGGEPAFRAKLEKGWGARVTEAMGIGDIGVSLWGECEEQDGMHLGARDFVHAELIEPETGAALELDDGATGELVLTHLQHRAAPLLRFRTRDHVQVRTSPCKCGRTGPRVRCVGRTDDMLIVRGVNVFPSAVREVVSAFAPQVSGHILVKPQAPGVKQEPPLPVSVELASGVTADDVLAEAIREKLRNVLVVQTRVELVPCGSLQRSEYKSKLVER
jgi:phenylacetate-CoA ligase